mmetsp:Transcript_18677/g.26210  ORF Transcript_18677/g.26210 Transcript_18677/m.26210 type:complete len:207 (-) Transcript_18677:986-1606(-)
MSKSTSISGLPQTSTSSSCQVSRFRSCTGTILAIPRLTASTWAVCSDRRAFSTKSTYSARLAELTRMEFPSCFSSTTSPEDSSAVKDSLIDASSVALSQLSTKLRIWMRFWSIADRSDRVRVSSTKGFQMKAGRSRGNRTPVRRQMPNSNPRNSKERLVLASMVRLGRKSHLSRFSPAALVALGQGISRGLHTSCSSLAMSVKICR